MSTLRVGIGIALLVALVVGCSTSDAELAVRGAVLHELAHAWTLDHVSKDLKGRFLDFVGLDIWQQADLPWSEQGVEYSAEVIAWGLLDRPSRMVRIGDPDCEDLADAFRLLTDAEPLQECGTTITS